MGEKRNPEDDFVLSGRIHQIEGQEYRGKNRNEQVEQGFSVFAPAVDAVVVKVAGEHHEPCQNQD